MKCSCVVGNGALQLDLAGLDIKYGIKTNAVKVKLMNAELNCA